MEVELSSRFKKSFCKLQPRLQKKAVLRMKIFKESRGRDNRLNIHKLHGDKHNEWAYSVDYSYRISFVFIESDKVLYLDIGTHNEVY